MYLNPEVDMKRRLFRVVLVRKTLERQTWPNIYYRAFLGLKLVAKIR